MNEITFGIIISIVALGVSILSAFFRRNNPTPESALQKRIKILESTIEIMQESQVKDRVQIANLQRDLALARNEIALLRQQYEPYNRVNESPFLLYVSTSSEMDDDLASLRGVRERTGLQFTAILNATKENLKNTLDRYRSDQRPLKYIHFACHSNKTGIGMADGIADPIWLSEQLSNLNVLLMVISGCNSDHIGDMLDVIPIRITMLDKISHTDASQFAATFWNLIGSGNDPSISFAKSKRLIPSNVAEMLEIHY